MNKAKVEPKACRESCATQRFRRRSTCTHRKTATKRELRRGKTELVVAHRVEATWKTITLQTTGGDAPVVGVKNRGVQRRLRRTEHSCHRTGNHFLQVIRKRVVVHFLPSREPLETPDRTHSDGPLRVLNHPLAIGIDPQTDQQLWIKSRPPTFLRGWLDKRHSDPDTQPMSKWLSPNGLR